MKRIILVTVILSLFGCMGVHATVKKIPKVNDRALLKQMPGADYKMPIGIQIQPKDLKDGLITIEME